MPIGENLKFIREHFQITQEGLAKIARVSNQSVSNWENNIKIPRMGAIQRIADYYGMKTSDIIEDDAARYALVKTESENMKIQLDKYYNELSTNGQQKVVEFAEMLSQSPKYSKKEN